MSNEHEEFPTWEEVEVVLAKPRDRWTDDDKGVVAMDMLREGQEWIPQMQALHARPLESLTRRERQQVADWRLADAIARAFMENDWQVDLEGVDKLPDYGETNARLIAGTITEEGLAAMGKRIASQLRIAKH